VAPYSRHHWRNQEQSYGLTGGGCFSLPPGEEPAKGALALSDLGRALINGSRDVTTFPDGPRCGLLR